jgi:uncharacterized protein (DUF697 family)
MSEKDVRATQIIRQYAAFAAGAGLIPITGVDFAAIAGVEYKMLAELASVYGVQFEADRVRPIVAALIGAYASKRLGLGMGAGVLKAIPVVGTLVGAVSVPVMAGGLTWAIGRVFVQHFASGGTFLTFDPAKVREHFEAVASAPAA